MHRRGASSEGRSRLPQAAADRVLALLAPRPLSLGVGQTGRVCRDADDSADPRGRHPATLGVAWRRGAAGKSFKNRSVTGAGQSEHAQAGFREGLRELGYVDGPNILVEYRSAVGQMDRLSDLAADLARLKVDIIVADGTLATQAAKRATAEIPIVMARVGDPVGTGLIATLARPGGNVTGVSSATADLGGKLLELIREVQPAMTRVAVLAHATDPFARPFVEQIQSAASRVGARMQRVVVRGVEEFDDAFAAMVKERAGGVIVQPILATKRAADLALKHRLPSITAGVGVKTFPEFGGLMSYGTNPLGRSRRTSMAMTVHRLVAASGELRVRKGQW